MPLIFLWTGDQLQLLRDDLFEMKIHLVCASSQMHYMYNVIVDNFNLNMLHVMLLINFTFLQRQAKTETPSNHVIRIIHRLWFNCNTVRCFKVVNPSQLIDSSDNLFELRYSFYNICIVANSVKCCSTKKFHKLVRSKKKRNETDKFSLPPSQ